MPERQRFSTKKLLKRSWGINKEIFPQILKAVLPAYVFAGLLSYFVKASSSSSAMIWGIMEAYFVAYLAPVVKLKLENPNFVVDKKYFKTHFQPAMKRVFKTFIRLIILITLLFLLLIIPGIIFLVYWSFALQAAALKDLNKGEALSYSKKLVKGRWWKIFWLVVLRILFVIIGIFPFALLIPEGLVFEIASSIVVGLVISYFIVVMTVLFLDLDKNREAPKVVPTE